MHVLVCNYVNNRMTSRPVNIHMYIDMYIPMWTRMYYMYLPVLFMACTRVGGCGSVPPVPAEPSVPSVLLSACLFKLGVILWLLRDALFVKPI